MASMSESLECSVCLLTYSLSDRRPKALGCQHTICEQCVDHLTKGSSISCPTCRQQSPSNQVAVNFAVTTILQAMCAKCFSMPHEMKCPHCSEHLCIKCIERHKESMCNKLVLALKELDGVIQQAADFVKDGSFVKWEKKKESETINDIKQAIQSHRDELDRLEKRLKTEVELTKEKNLAGYKQQSKTLTDKINTMKGFPAKNLKRLFGQNLISIQEMVSLHHKCKSLTEELSILTFDAFIFDDYSFTKSTSTFDPSLVGTLVTHRIDMNRIPEPSDSSEPDYLTLRYHGHTGSLGSGQDHFNKPSDVLCTTDKIIVSDQLNHRLKFHDNDLNLQCVIGVKGSGRGQFCNPAGLATGPGGELYVADFNNHRVVVMTSLGEYLREICKMGSGEDELNHPHGIAISDGYVYIADSYNYRIKVIKTDGSFVKHIGSKGDEAGQFQDKPFHVALMSRGDGRVLVKEYKKQQFRVFSRTGEYKGLFPPTIPAELATAVPNDITVDRSDNVIATYNTGKLAVYNSQGALITVLIGSYGHGPGQFVLPLGVSVNTLSGHVVVCDILNHRLQMFKFDCK